MLLQSFIAELKSRGKVNHLKSTFGFFEEKKQMQDFRESYRTDKPNDLEQSVID